MKEIIDYLQEKAIEYHSVFEECPNCGYSVSPEIVDSEPFYNEIDHIPMHFFILKCNRVACYRYFIIEVELQHKFPEGTHYIIGHNVYPKRFEQYNDKVIGEFSPRFIEIYNQAKIADKMNLHEISGPGYRKALEFLVKDFIIHSHKEDSGFDENLVRNSKSVVKLIKNHIDNEKIVRAAERAFWIGNDSTHYEREWMDLDNDDLKVLIEIVIYHVKLELQMKYYEEKMTRNK